MGLYDMLGNVWERCLDGQRSYTADSVTDPVGSRGAGGARVLRGGSWNDFAQGVRSAYRSAIVPGYRSNYGLLCAADGCPVAVEVFAGDVGDPKTLATQIDKLKKRFALTRVVLVADPA